MANWLTIPEAAKRLGVTPQAIRNRIKANTLEHQRNNQGRILVLIPDGVDAEASERGKLEARLADLEAELAQVRADAAKAMEDAQERHRAALTAAEQRHTAELARLEAAGRTTLDALDRRHLEELDRLAEAHAETVHALRETLEKVTAPWWVRLFGR